MMIKSKIVLGAIALNVLLGCVALLVYYQYDEAPLINTRAKKSIDVDERAAAGTKVLLGIGYPVHYEMHYF